MSGGGGWYGGNWPVCTLFPRRIPHKYKGCLVRGCRGVGKKKEKEERERKKGKGKRRKKSSDKRDREYLEKNELV